DNAGSVKLWEITRDSKLGNLAAFGYPAMLFNRDVLSKCFSAEMYSADLNICVCMMNGGSGSSDHQGAVDRSFEDDLDFINFLNEFHADTEELR
ncbi:hypothetical protein Tco_0281333, partial [Tanacetum coccineum]